MTQQTGPKTVDDVVIVTTVQESRFEMLEWNEETDREKDLLLARFTQFAVAACRQLQEAGYWADYADPASGLLIQSGGQVVWPEVQSLERLRGYRLSKAGACHILLHPLWGSRMYPASLFTDAPEHVVRGALQVKA